MRAAGFVCAAACLLASFAWGEDAGSAVARHPSGATIWRMDDGALAIPLIGPRPEWFTEDVRARTVEASSRGLAYDFVANSAVAPAPSEVLLRPGTQIFPDGLLGESCTAAFVFDGIRRIATAGHCTKLGDHVLALAAPSILVDIGTTSYSTNGGPIGYDWALIDINATWRPYTDPTVALVGGPCGQAQAQPVVPLVKYVGHGLGIGTGGTARSGILDVRDVYSTLEPKPSGFIVIGAAYSGDSGCPVLETLQSMINPPCAAGGAVGILTHVSALDTGIEDPVIPTGFFFGTPIDRILSAGHQLDNAAINLP